MNHWNLIGFVGLWTSMTIIAPVRAESDNTQAASHTALDQSTHAKGKFAALPPLGLIPMEGFDDDAAYLSSVKKRIAELTTSADQATDQVNRISLRLAAANEVLAYELEPSATRFLLQLPADDDAPSDRDLVKLFQKADNLLHQIDQDLKALPQVQDLPTGWPQKPNHQRETLGALATGLQLCLLNPSQMASISKTRKSASSMAMLREDANPAVAEAATLWRSAIRLKNNDIDTALTVLDLALVDPNPAPEAMPYAIFSRFLRCRVLAKQQSFASALALLIQLEERSIDWPMDDELRVSTVHAAQYFRTQVLRDWHQALPDKQPKEKQWCVQQYERIREEFEGGEENLYRLSAAIPIIAPIP